MCKFPQKINDFLGHANMYCLAVEKSRIFRAAKLEILQAVKNRRFLTPTKTRGFCG